MHSIRSELLIPVISKIRKIIAEVSAGKLFFLTVSGAHLYGFASANSDIDLRGAYIADTNILLGLNGTKETLTSLNPDYHIHELRKFILLALKGNCNIAEQLTAKPVFATPEFLQFKRMFLDYGINKDGLYKSYRGMAAFNYKKFILGGKISHKKYLYIFRALLAGRFVLEREG